MKIDKYNPDELNGDNEILYNSQDYDNEEDDSIAWEDSDDIIMSINKEYGDNMKFLYEKYLQVFFKQKKRNYFISKEFQLNVNKVIERLQKANESKLSNYLVKQSGY